MDNTTGLPFYLINNTIFSENVKYSAPILPDIPISQVKEDSSILSLFLIISAAVVLFLCYLFYFVQACFIYWTGQVPNPYEPGVHGMPEYPFAQFLRS